MFYFNISEYGYIPENSTKEGAARYECEIHYCAKNVRDFKRQLHSAGYTRDQIRWILSPRCLRAFLYKGDTPYEVEVIVWQYQTGFKHTMEFHELDPHSLKYARANWVRKQFSQPSRDG